MIFSYLLNMQSHPSWVCGLKHHRNARWNTDTWSHPSWVCGLKLISLKPATGLYESHPSWVCGLKHYQALQEEEVIIVTPFVGVWIETEEDLSGRAGGQGHTLRGCVD